MKISIISMGKFENSPHKAVFNYYLERIKWKVELKELELKNTQNLSSFELKTKEADLIIKAIKPQSKLIILDEKGQQFSSRDFAKLIANFAVNGDSNLSLVIGGADGLSEDLQKKASLKISLGLMTLPHLMVRSVLAEQLYRAQTIINNHPYHRD